MNDGTDAFKDALDDLKRQAEHERVRPSEEASARMWARIDEATRASAAADREPAPRALRRVPVPVWMGIAATLVIGTAIIVLVLQRPDTQLVASAGDERLEHALADGSIVTLRPYSELYMVTSGSETARYRLTGEAYFDVAPQPDRVFAVEAGEALVEVLGTEFNLSTWGESTSIYLEEGRVRFAHRPSGTDVILQPGESSRIAEGVGPVAPSPAAPDEHLDWLDGEIVFDQRPVGIVAEELEHHFSIRLDIPAPTAAETLSGRILLDSKHQSLDDLARALDGRFVATSPSSYTFESDRPEAE